MAIFISHASSDNHIAATVFNRLESYHHIDCYLDDIDTRLRSMRGSSELTAYLVSIIKKHDTVLAVVTRNTQQSWWVPFEIGTAREIPRIITSYTDLPEPTPGNYFGTLPEYLLEWPRLRSQKEIDVFAEKYKERQRLQEREKNFSDQLYKDVPRWESPREFEHNLMRTLNQRSVI